jgi:hypothetical protein
MNCSSPQMAWLAALRVTDKAHVATKEPSTTYTKDSTTAAQETLQQDGMYQQDPMSACKMPQFFIFFLLFIFFFLMEPKIP